MNKLLVLFAIVIGLLSKTYAFDTAKLDKQITETYPVDVRSCEEKNNKESCLTVSSNILTAAIDSTGDKKQYLTNKAVTYYHKACRNTQNASSDIKKACPMVYNQIKRVKKYTEERGARVREGSIRKGEYLYRKQIRENCELSHIQFPRQHTVAEWQSLGYTHTLLKEFTRLCPQNSFKEKWLRHLYAYVVEYASGTGNEPTW